MKSDSQMRLSGELIFRPRRLADPFFTELHRNWTKPMFWLPLANDRAKRARRRKGDAVSLAVTFNWTRLCLQGVR
jgi:hypothetical protein